MDLGALILSVVLLLATTAVGCKDGKAKDAPTTPAKTPSSAVATTPEPPLAPDTPKLVRTKPLPELARASIRNRMQNHGDDTENLLWATLMLDYELTEGIAKVISKEPTLARPQEDDLTTINAMLPPEFFDLQDELVTSVDAIGRAAKARNDEAIASEYGKIVKTCISCHSLYLNFDAPL